MSSWIWSGRTALLYGALFFALVFLPTVAWQYRRWGSWNLKRLGGTAAVVLYATALVTYTWLPLPPRSEAWCAEHVIAPQLRPLAMLDALAAAWATHGVGMFGRFTFLQVAFNVLLFVPLGLLVRRYLHRSIWETIAVAFGVSLLIEMSQLTGLWGIYPCAYRVFDVDDLIVNTLGGAVGALIAPALLWWMPRATLLEAGRLRARPVTALRRWTGQAIDGALLLAGDMLATIVLRVTWTALDRDPMSVPDWLWLPLAVVLPWVIVCVFPPWRHLAASPGQTAVWLTPVWVVDGRVTHGTLAQRLLRANVTALPYVLSATVLRLLGFGGLVANAWWLVLAAASVALVPFTRTHRSLSGALTGAEFHDIRSLPQVRDQA